MEVVRQPVGSLLAQPIQLRVPLFQRPYVWRKGDHWAPLWQTIASAAALRREAAVRAHSSDAHIPRAATLGGPRASHFLGAIVLEQETTTTLEMGNLRRIIDGQQRLTTIQVLLCAVRNIAQQRRNLDADVAYVVEVAERLTTNLVIADVERPKVVPTTADVAVFREVMSSPSVAAVRQLIRPNDAVPRLVEAYLFFDEQVRAWLNGESATDLKYIVDAIQTDLLLVVINLDGVTDNAQEIFETLNARGEPLVAADLVKNYLFRTAQTEGTQPPELTALYEMHWSPFDRDQAYWRRSVGSGRNAALRVNAFLQHYLTLMKRGEVVVGSLYPEFKAYLEEKRTGAGLAQVGPVVAVSELETLDAYARVYRSFQGFAAESVEGAFFGRLEALDVRTFDPVLLEAFHRRQQLGDAELFQILRDLESYLVRRSVCRLSTRSYNRLAVELLKAVRDEFSAAAIRAFFLRQTTEDTLWPIDGDFRNSWRSEPMYLGRRARVRTILEALETAMRTSRTETVPLGRLTVDHLMPQNWPKNWPLPPATSEADGERRRGALIHTIGNLTLLTQELNSSVSDGGWITRRAAMLEHSVLMLNNELRHVDHWSEDEIERRADALFDRALRLWPHPDASLGTALGAGSRREPPPSLATGPADAQREALLAEFAEAVGEDMVDELRRLVTGLASVPGAKVQVGRSFAFRVRVPPGDKRVTLFFIEKSGHITFSRASNALAAGRDAVEQFFRAIAEAYDLELHDGVPARLELRRVIEEPEALDRAARAITSPSTMGLDGRAAAGPPLDPGAQLERVFGRLREHSRGDVVLQKAQAIRASLGNLDSVIIEPRGESQIVFRWRRTDSRPLTLGRINTRRATFTPGKLTDARALNGPAVSDYYRAVAESASMALEPEVQPSAPLAEIDVALLAAAVKTFIVRLGGAIG